MDTIGRTLEKTVESILRSAATPMATDAILASLPFGSEARVRDVASRCSRLVRAGRAELVRNGDGIARYRAIAPPEMKPRKRRGVPVPCGPQTTTVVTFDGVDIDAVHRVKHADAMQASEPESETQSGPQETATSASTECENSREAIDTGFVMLPKRTVRILCAGVLAMVEEPGPALAAAVKDAVEALT